MKTQNKNLVIKMIAGAALAVSLGLSSIANASDLSADLRTPFQDMTNPFANASEKPLPSSVAAVLRNLLANCAYTPTSTNQKGLRVDFDAALVSGCESEITASYERTKDGRVEVGNKLYIHSGRLFLQVVSWDGANSDGGDEQAIGIYDLAGNRVAVYPGLYVIGNALDGLAHAVGAKLSTKQQ